MSITLQRTESQLVASMASVGGFAVQSGQARIYVDGRLVISIEEITFAAIRSTLVMRDGSENDVSCDVPADSRYSFDKTVAFWMSFLMEREEAFAASPVPTPDPVEYHGAAVNAPGFTSQTFASGVEKAIRLGTLHMYPGREGAVLVMSAHSDARYRVTRTDCSCLGHEHTGHCYHRAAVLYVHDVCGIDVTREPLLGFDPLGNPVTKRAREAHLAA